MYTSYNKTKKKLCDIMPHGKTKHLRNAVD